MQFSTRQTGYGLWFATARTPDGREFTGGGLSEQEAIYRAKIQAERAAPQRGKQR